MSNEHAQIFSAGDYAQLEIDLTQDRSSAPEGFSVHAHIVTVSDLTPGAEVSLAFGNEPPHASKFITVKEGATLYLERDRSRPRVATQIWVRNAPEPNVIMKLVASSQGFRYEPPPTTSARITEVGVVQEMLQLLEQPTVDKASLAAAVKGLPHTANYVQASPDGSRTAVTPLVFENQYYRSSISPDFAGWRDNSEEDDGLPYFLVLPAQHYYYSPRNAGSVLPDEILPGEVGAINWGDVVIIEQLTAEQRDAFGRIEARLSVQQGTGLVPIIEPNSPSVIVTARDGNSSLNYPFDESLGLRSPRILVSSRRAVSYLSLIYQASSKATPAMISVRGRIIRAADIRAAGFPDWFRVPPE